MKGGVNFLWDMVGLAKSEGDSLTMSKRCQNLSLTVRAGPGTHRSGSIRPWDILSMGRFVQGMNRPRDVSSRDAMFKNTCSGTHWSGTLLHSIYHRIIKSSLADPLISNYMGGKYKGAG